LKLFDYRGQSAMGLAYFAALPHSKRHARRIYLIYRKLSSEVRQLLQNAMKRGRVKIYINTCAEKSQQTKERAWKHARH
jgi:hypothetical protein